jgi:hypothetical protein
VLRRVPMTICGAVLLCAVPVAGMAQAVDPLDATSKLNFHVQTVGSPWSLAESARHTRESSKGWTLRKSGGRAPAAYWKRFASALGGSAIHGVLAFGLDSTLHQDPRYFRSLDPGFWRRTAHAFRGTILTRTDARAKHCPHGVWVVTTELHFCPTSGIRLG